MLSHHNRVLSIQQYGLGLAGSTKIKVLMKTVKGPGKVVRLTQIPHANILNTETCMLSYGLLKLILCFVPART